jgi:hypothetical protein
MTRHWRSDGTEPLPSGAEAMCEQPVRAFPSWFLRIECDRCGKLPDGFPVLPTPKPLI